MAASELDSFVFRFKNLWRTVLDTKLNMNCQAGQAWVQLNVGLGHPLDLPPPQPRPPQPRPPQHVHQESQKENSRHRRHM